MAAAVLDEPQGWLAHIWTAAMGTTSLLIIGTIGTIGITAAAPLELPDLQQPSLSLPWVCSCSWILGQ